MQALKWTLPVFLLVSMNMTANAAEIYRNVEFSQVEGVTLALMLRSPKLRLQWARAFSGCNYRPWRRLGRGQPANRCRAFVPAVDGRGHRLVFHRLPAGDRSSSTLVLRQKMSKPRFDS